MAQNWLLPFGRRILLLNVDVRQLRDFSADFFFVWTLKFPHTLRAANTFIKKGTPITFFPSTGFLRNAHMRNPTGLSRPPYGLSRPLSPYNGGHDFFQTLKWPKIPEDSSDFDDFLSELIVMT